MINRNYLCYHKKKKTENDLKSDTVFRSEWHFIMQKDINLILKYYLTNSAFEIIRHLYTLKLPIYLWKVRVQKNSFCDSFEMFLIGLL